jgi:hypothetical protein
LAPVTTVALNNGAGATLNRVVDSHPSVIIGHLSATGSVYLINPQGVIVGPRVGCAGRSRRAQADRDRPCVGGSGPHHRATASGTSPASIARHMAKNAHRHNRYRFGGARAMTLP